MRDYKVGDYVKVKRDWYIGMPEIFNGKIMEIKKWFNGSRRYQIKGIYDWGEYFILGFHKTEIIRKLTREELDEMMVDSL